MDSTRQVAEESQALVERELRTRPWMRLTGVVWGPMDVDIARRLVFLELDRLGHRITVDEYRIGRLEADASIPQIILDCQVRNTVTFMKFVRILHQATGGALHVGNAPIYEALEVRYDTAAPQTSFRITFKYRSLKERQGFLDALLHSLGRIPV